MSESALPQSLGPGSLLRHARTERGLATSDVAGRLKYAVRQIEALESDDYAKLPGATFLRGMIRGYAKLVELDSEPFLKALDGHQVRSQFSVELPSARIPFPDGRKRGNRMYLALSALLLVAGAAVLYEWHFGAPAILGDGTPQPVAVLVPPRTDAQAAPIASDSQPTVQPPPLEAPASPMTPVSSDVAATNASTAPEAPVVMEGKKRIVLEFLKESWVEVRDGDGRRLLSQLNPAGTQKVIDGAPPISLVIGNAAYVHLTFDDKPVDLKPYVKVEVARLTLE